MNTGSKTLESFLRSPHRSIKHSTYFHVYDSLFSRFRGEPITFVEIGVLSGGSLHMWRDYFGPDARIIGIDLSEDARKWESDGFEIFVGNQSDPGFWSNFFSKVGAVDVLLDDGGHTYLQQITTCLEAADFIKDGGLIVVEDTHTSQMSGFGFRGHSFFRWAKKELTSVQNRFSSLRARGWSEKVWSVEFFESIVAFKIQRVFCGVKSEVADNQGLQDGARDLRASDPLSRGSMNLLGTYSPQLRLSRLFRSRI